MPDTIDTLDTLDADDLIAELLERQRPAGRILLTRLTSKGGNVRKKLVEAPEGGLDHAEDWKLSVWAGHAELVAIDDLVELKALIGNIGSDQCLVHGVAEKDGEIVSKRRVGQVYGAIARTKEFFRWPDQAHLLMLDCDAEPGVPSLTPEEAIAHLQAFSPVFQDFGCLVVPSSSAAIRRVDDGQIVKDSRNYHLYFVVRGDVDRFKTEYAAWCWLRGHGRIKIGEPNKQWLTSAKLTRYPFDLFVWSPERFDYVAPALLPEGYESCRELRLLGDSDCVVDLDAIVGLTPEEHALAEAAKSAAKQAVAPVIERAAVERLLESGRVKTVPEAIAKARETIAKEAIGSLEPDHKLYTPDGAVFLAGDLTDAHQDLELLDPWEPDYRNRQQCAIVCRSSCGMAIFSQAHGGRLWHCKVNRRPPVLKPKT